MSADDLEEFYVHTVTVEKSLGKSGYGVDLFDPPVTVQGFLDGTRHLVRNKDGDQVVSESTFYTYPSNGALFNPAARVTDSVGVVSRVIKTNVNDSGDLDLPDHVAVSLE